MHAVTSNAVAESCLNVETVTGTTDAGNGSYTIKKVGKIVTLDVVNIEQSAGSDIQVLTIPQEYRPTQNIAVVGNYGNGNFEYCVVFTIGTNGKVATYAYQAFQANDIPQLHACWIV